MPLLRLPGEAPMDFGQALVRIGGVLRVVSFLAMALPHSDAFFVMAFERELTEGFKQLLSHYLFDPHFCLVRRANEKGVVEGVVKFTRLKQSRRRLKRQAKREVENPGESSETHEE